MARKQVDPCMFCGMIPCECEPKKKPAKKKPAKKKEEVKQVEPKVKEEKAGGPGESFAPKAGGKGRAAASALLQARRKTHSPEVGVGATVPDSSKQRGERTEAEAHGDEPDQNSARIDAKPEHNSGSRGGRRLSKLGVQQGVGHNSGDGGGVRSRQRQSVAALRKRDIGLFRAARTFESLGLVSRLPSELQPDPASGSLLAYLEGDESDEQEPTV